MSAKKAVGKQAQPGDRASNEGSYNAGLSAFSYIAGGIIVWSLIGWGVSILLNSPWITLIGVAVGLAGGFYLANHHGYFRPQGSTVKDQSGEKDT